MAVTRATATVDQDIVLRAHFRKISGEYLDVFKVKKVQILDTNGVTELEEILTAAVTELATGQYEITAAKASFDVGGTYFDKWTIEEEEGDADTDFTASIVVVEAGPSFKERPSAITNHDVILYAEYRNSVTGALFDPDSIDKVEILDLSTNGSAILQTVVAPNIIKVKVGVYYIIADGTKLDEAGTYTDKWYATINLDDAQTSVSLTFDVAAAVGAGIGDRLVTITVLDALTEVVQPDLDVIATEKATGIKLLSTTTDGSGKAYFNADLLTYIFTIRDPLDTAKVYSVNNLEHTVADERLLASGDANPNILQFLVTELVPDWDVGTPLAAADLCLVSGSFVDLKGVPIKDLEVRVQNNFVPTIRSTRAVLGDDLIVKTNAAGKVSFNLVRTSEVTVTFVGAGLTRRLTIPDASTADLTSLLGAAEDMFTIAKDDTIVLVPRAA